MDDTIRNEILEALNGVSNSQASAETQLSTPTLLKFKNGGTISSYTEEKLLVFHSRFYVDYTEDTEIEPPSQSSEKITEIIADVIVEPAVLIEEPCKKSIFDYTPDSMKKINRERQKEAQKPYVRKPILPLFPTPTLEALIDKEDLTAPSMQLTPPVFIPKKENVVDLACDKEISHALKETVSSTLRGPKLGLEDNASILLKILQRNDPTYVFIDGANFGTTVKNFNLIPDYLKLWYYFHRNANFIRAYFYAAAKPKIDAFGKSVYDPMEPLFDWLKNNRYQVVQRELVTSHDGSMKGNMDGFMVTDMMDIAYQSVTPKNIILFSGDGDFTYPLQKMQQRGMRCIVISMYVPKGNVAHRSIRETADLFLNLTDLDFFK